MLRFVALGLLVALVLYWLGRRFVAADPARMARTLRWSALSGGALVLLYLAVSGRLAAVGALLAVLVPFVLRAQAVWRKIKATGGAATGRHSEVTTRFLRMTLDHDSGVMNGTVLEGRFRGRELRQLAVEDLIVLWEECRAADEQSAAVLEAYLDRTQGQAWRTQRDAGGAAREEVRGAGPMTREEAYQILGLAPEASPAEIKAAHRRLMQKLHPDQGGSTYLAAKINQAKDLLLGR